jgi:two-component system, cell cycle sensor histidine kinase and response regulator CckA
VTGAHAVTHTATHSRMSFDHGNAEQVGPALEPILPELCALGHVRSPTDQGDGSLHRQLGQDLDLRLRHHDGSESPVGICIAPVETTDDPYFVTTIVDITMRMALADVLADGERRYRTVLETAPYAIIAVDATGTIVFANPLAGTTFGYPSHALLDQSLELLLPEDVISRHRSHVEGFLSHPVPRPMGTGLDLVGRRSDGSTFPVEIALAPVDTAKGPQVFAAVVDITLRKAAEAQLLQAQQMEGLGRLAGGVAHDMNNYLGAIRGFADLLLEDLDAPILPTREELISRARVITDSADRAADLTRQLLAFSRQQVLTPHVLDLSDAVAALEPMLRRLVGDNVRLVLERAPDALRMRADAGQLDQILVNLVVNARDAMPTGGTLRIETRRSSHSDTDAARHFGVQPGKYVTLIVSDTGVGMDAEVRKHAFDPFYTTKELGKGTGLGLATVRGVVAQSGGHVWLYSEPGHGTTFKIMFPELSDAVERPAGPGPTPRRRSGGRVLVVEDAEVVRDYTTQVLTRAGYTVTAVPDATDALRLLGAISDPVDVLVSDVVMPGMSGIALARHVRAQFPAVGIVLVSGYTAGSLDLEEAVVLGATFVGKPFTREELLRAVAATGVVTTRR